MLKLNSAALIHTFWAVTVVNICLFANSIFNRLKVVKILSLSGCYAVFLLYCTYWTVFFLFWLNETFLLKFTDQDNKATVPNHFCFHHPISNWFVKYCQKQRKLWIWCKRNLWAKFIPLWFLILGVDTITIFVITTWSR